MTNSRNRSWNLGHLGPALMGIAAACGSGNAAAQDAAYPTRTVQFVVAYTPGTGADILARAFGPKLAERWKVAVVTENRAGATGTIATVRARGRGANRSPT